MSLPTKLEQALNYKWHPGNVDTLHRLMMERILEIDRKFSNMSGDASLTGSVADPCTQAGDITESPRAPGSISDKSWRDYDSEPDGLED